MAGDGRLSGETAGRRAAEADREAALEANRALYEALENGDLAAVEDAWLGAGEADDKGAWSVSIRAGRCCAEGHR